MLLEDGPGDNAGDTRGRTKTGEAPSSPSGASLRPINEVSRTGECDTNPEASDLAKGANESLLGVRSRDNIAGARSSSSESWPSTMSRDA